jgi:hypothetical protein
MSEGTKKCRMCDAEKPLSEFRLFQGKYRQSYCHDCDREYHRKWSKSERGRECLRAKEKKRYARDPNHRKEHAKDFRERRLDRIFSIYGPICRCCGETERAFLTVDHINNDGGIERKAYGGNEKFRNWLAKQPKLPEYQILCWNCQWGKRINGVCPHQVEKGRHLTLVEGGNNARTT